LSPQGRTAGDGPLLTGIKSFWAPKLLALLLGPFDALVRALADQASLKLSNAAQ
jgi:hypothetical protein